VRGARELEYKCPFPSSMYQNSKQLLNTLSHVHTDIPQHKDTCTYIQSMCNHKTRLLMFNV
jgi:hypothetical protein